MSFITNSKEKTLKKRIDELIKCSSELKFLVGFFYFSGMKELYHSLKEESDVVLKILVGLDVDSFLSQIILVEKKDNSDARIVENYLNSIKKGINRDEFDTEEFYSQVLFFLEMIKKNRIVIRKTSDPNHAKLYIFKLKERLFKNSCFITGSSNLTQAGLKNQHEFNVEISDYGTEDAEKYFDELWEQAVEITENNVRKQKLIDTIEMNTLVAEVTPFEAYTIVLKTYLDTLSQKEIKKSIRELLLEKGYFDYKYQMDAAAQASTIIDYYGGVIIADVVGLGKSIIAGITAKQHEKRGVIICPPYLVGDENRTSGWKKYCEDFALHDWEVRSCGVETLKNTLEFVRNHEDIGIVIIDEAHRFRNQNTEAYELLSHICRGKKVILLSATPFNNSPADVFALLKLFVIPGKSKITLSNDLEFKFNYFQKIFNKLSHINKNYLSKNDSKRTKAQTYFIELFGSKNIDIKKVKERARALSTEIRSVIEPVLIRRNRIDIKNDPEYSKEINDLPNVNAPKELFFELTKEQSLFYDKVINDYFGEEGEFLGAIYTPFLYEIGVKDSEEKIEGSAENFEIQSQKNLFDFMRRLLVKRFESSFNSFAKSIENFKKINELAQNFIEKTNGKFVLDRKLIEQAMQNDADIEKILEDYEQKLSELDEKKLVKQKIYDTNKFKAKQEFFANIEADKQLFTKILNEINELNLIEKDPKAVKLTNEIEAIFLNKNKKEPLRKVIIFTEYADTASYLFNFIQKKYQNQVFKVDGTISENALKEILYNFDASSKIQKDDFQILVATDKISEGFNLSRAGAIINYDIPWNPTRVIQRVGRINRIGKKVFDDLFIYNFFPTEQGADVVKSREIAAEKMFMIHNTLGEDTQIFESDEELKPSGLFKKINENPSENEEESLQTKIRKAFLEVKRNHPEIIDKIEKLPSRIKTAKNYPENELFVFIKKGLGFFVRGAVKDGDEVKDYPLEEAILHIECQKDEKKQMLSSNFWRRYQFIKEKKEEAVIYKENSTEKKALNNLKAIEQFLPEDFEPYRPLVTALLEDIQEFRTLPDYTLSVISQLKLDFKNEKSLKLLQKTLEKIDKELGEDYIESVKIASENINSEIIIAIENRKNEI